MKYKILLLLLLFSLSSPVLFAQLGLEISLNRSVYMRYEHIYAHVVIRNDSGRALLFGNDPKLQGFVLFEIKDSRGNVVKQRVGSDITVAGLIIGSGEVKRMIIPIDKYYDLSKTDDYSINVYVSHNQLNEEYQSADVYFRVEDGIKIWSRTLGVTEVLIEKGAVPVNRERTYTIRALTESPNRFYYLVVEDKEKVYGVMRIGRAIGREEFQAEIDMLSRIHLLIPISPKVFHYLSFSIDGETVNNSFWKISGTIPMLYRDPSTGLVSRLGGVEAKKGIDFRDPDRGTVTAAKLLQDNEPDIQRPEPPKSSGLVELGSSLNTPIRTEFK